MVLEEGLLGHSSAVCGMFLTVSGWGQSHSWLSKKLWEQGRPCEEMTGSQQVWKGWSKTKFTLDKWKVKCLSSSIWASTAKKGQEERWGREASHVRGKPHGLNQHWVKSNEPKVSDAAAKSASEKSHGNSKNRQVPPMAKHWSPDTQHTWAWASRVVRTLEAKTHRQLWSRAFGGLLAWAVFGGTQV